MRDGWKLLQDCSAHVCPDCSKHGFWQEARSHSDFETYKALRLTQGVASCYARRLHVLCVILQLLFCIIIAWSISGSFHLH